MEQVKRNISRCTLHNKDAFIGIIPDRGFEMKSTNVDGKVTTYGFMREGNRVGIIFDSATEQLTLNGMRDDVDELQSLYDMCVRLGNSMPVVHTPTLPSVTVTSTAKKQDHRNGAKKTHKPQQDEKSVFDIVDELKRTRGKSVDESAPPQKSVQETRNDKANSRIGQDKAKGDVKRRPMAKRGHKDLTEALLCNADPIVESIVKGTQTNVETPPEHTELEYKNGYSVKNFAPEALKEVLKRLKTERGLVVDAPKIEFKDTIQATENYVVTDPKSGQKAIIRYAVNKKTVQLQGKRSNLFSEIQVLISKDSDYSTALGSHIEMAENDNKCNEKASAGEIHRDLRKRVPSAIEFMSDQSKIDFSIGLYDFERDNLQLSDYSVLLVPPYRGLERFIFDLQKAEDIKVKMIGQAFDKDDEGNYILKTGYARRIGSVIYAEVLTSLYSEYFARRNFYAHSDNTEDNMRRSIADKATAKKIFDNLLATVEYNAKKLKEIRFKAFDN